MMSVIDGVKRLTLPFTKSLSNLAAYEESLKQPQPQPRDIQAEAYNSLTLQERQAMSDAENTVFEVTRRAKILLEKAQRQTEDLQAAKDKIVSGYNKPFLPTQAELISKFESTLTEAEQTKIGAGLTAKQKLDQTLQTLLIELKDQEIK